MKTDRLLARTIASADADEQAGLFNSLARELYVACRGRRDYETQCSYLTDALDRDGIKFIKDLAEFITLREEDI